MPIDTSISDLAWLTQPADPGGNLTRGVAAGTQIANARAQRTGLAQRAMEFQQQMEIQKQQFAQELAQAPLKQTLLQQNAQMNALKLEAGLRDQQNLIDTESDFAGLANAVTHAMQEADPVDVNPLFFQAVAKRPRLAETDRFQTLWKDYNTSLNAKLALRSGQFTPEEIVVPSQVPGQPPTRVLRTSPNQVTLVPGSAPPAPSSAEKNFNKLDVLQQALTVANASGDPAAIAEAKRRLDTFSALASPPSETMSFDPKTGTFTVTRGKPAGDLTTASTTQLQEGLQADVTSIDIANRLEPLISSETVGMRAFAGSVFKDRVLAQFFKNVSSEDRAKAEVLSAEFRAATVERLKSDGNISEPERKEILKAVPGINQPADSPDHARDLVQAARKVAALHAITKASKLGVKVPAAAALVLPWTELRDLAKTGVLTPEQATAAYDAQIKARGQQ